MQVRLPWQRLPSQRAGPGQWGAGLLHRQRLRPAGPGGRLAAPLPATQRGRQVVSTEYSYRHYRGVSTEYSYRHYRQHSEDVKW